ncbi:MAG: VTT domain-containing protein [Anaerolineales bacterium]|nr:VTT domain-containing protein [Anaerolineales bacterium]
MDTKTSQPSKEKRPLSLTITRIVALLFVIALTVYIIYMPEDQAEKFESWGYLGIFLISILANATVIIPAPGLVIVFSMGAKFSPLLVGIAAGLGATLGELSGYLAGFSGQAVIENQERYDQLVSWMERNGPLTVAVLAFIPNPLFDLAGMIAGALKMPVFRFLFYVMIGKILKMLVFAYAGAGVLNAPWLDKLLTP